jgi:hypothetical protein
MPRRQLAPEAQASRDGVQGPIIFLPPTAPHRSAPPITCLFMLRMYRGGTEVPPEVGGQGSRPEAEKRPFAPAEGTSDKYKGSGG